jgi:hypothetical protein
MGKKSMHSYFAKKNACAAWQKNTTNILPRTIKKISNGPPLMAPHQKVSYIMYKIRRYIYMRFLKNTRQTTAGS